MSPEEQVLLVSVEGPSSEEDATAIEGIVAQLAKRPWFHVAPEFINEVDTSETIGPGDAPALTLGAFLRLPAPTSTRDVEERCLADVEAFFAPFQVYARETGCEFAVDLRGETIGWIEPNGMSAGLEAGLIEPWRERIQSM